MAAIISRNKKLYFLYFNLRNENLFLLTIKSKVILKYILTKTSFKIFNGSQNTSVNQVGNVGAS